MIFLKIALSVAAIALFIGTASFARGGDQGGDAMTGEQGEATGMPTPLSGSSQKSPSAQINVQAGVSNAASAGAHSGAQGWSGPGWYISSSESPAFKPRATPAYILFKGPYDRHNDCVAVYDRLYSPIGNCRLLDAKPGSLPR